jgi:beta-phosphoglucomutase-like phosphatase (HAD superfamily)
LLDVSGLVIDLTVTREEASLPQPVPEGLLRAMRLLKLVPDETVYVGDSAADVEQGRAAGARTLQLGPGGAGAPPGAPNGTFLMARPLDLPVAEGCR